MNAIEAFPLAWPVGRPRTDHYRRESSNFETTFARARDDIIREVALLKGTNVRYMRGEDVIISSNTPLRRDGLPLAGKKNPDDPGVAVYFTRNKKQMSFACDRWNKIEDNMRAIVKTIEALRGIARWGTGDMLEAAFTGFVALPSPGSNWRGVLAIPANVVGPGLETLKAYYRAAISEATRSGSTDAQANVNVAYDIARKELGYAA